MTDYRCEICHKKPSYVPKVMRIYDNELILF